MNVRLKAEDAITKKIMLTSFEKSQAHWPSEKECEFCRQNENTEWKDEIVLDFIMNHYWCVFYSYMNLLFSCIITLSPIF